VILITSGSKGKQVKPGIGQTQTCLQYKITPLL